MSDGMYVLRVVNGVGKITPPDVTEDPPKPVLRMLSSRSSLPPVYRSAPPPSPTPADYGVHTWEKWPGVTAMTVIDRTGRRLREAEILTEVLEDADIEHMRAWLAKHSGVTRLSLV